MDLVRRRRGNNRPATMLDRLQNDINRLFDYDWMPGEEDLLETNFAPRVDVQDRDNEVEVTAELPGVTKDDIDISVSDNVLHLRGDKKDEREENESNYYRREIFQGSFQRSIALPDTVDADKADAQMKEGVLHITFPKRAESRRKQISVKGS